MYCTECGKENADNAIFCKYWGTRIVDAINDKQSPLKDIREESDIQFKKSGASRKSIKTKYIVILLVVIISIVVVVSVGIKYYNSNSKTIAQKISSPDHKKEILSYLRNQKDCKSKYSKFGVDSVKVGPEKDGYIGYCKYGGGITVVYENTLSGLVRLLQVEEQMNSDHFMDKSESMGYYDFIVNASTGGKIYSTIYRWNGTRYIEVDEKQSQLSSNVQVQSSDLKNLRIKIIYSSNNKEQARLLEKKLKSNGAKVFSVISNDDYKSISMYAGMLYYYDMKDKKNAFKVTQISSEIASVKPTYDGNDPTIDAKRGEMTLWLITKQ